jgi:hypothetical protein
MRSQERINFRTGIDKQMRRKESSMLKSVNQKSLKRNREKEKNKQFSDH